MNKNEKAKLKRKTVPVPPRKRSRQLRKSAPAGRKRTSFERQRLSPSMRRRHLIEEAFAYFAEVGLGGSTRELAKRVGVTQPLLYRYFPTKDSLIEAVYDLIYVNRWRSEWTQTLIDRKLSLRDRLAFFYKSYTDNVLTREWLRIYLFAGLNGAELNQWCIGLLEERIFAPIYRELYAELRMPLPSQYRPSRAEVELVWNLHSAVFYYAVRKHVFQVPVLEDQHAAIEQAVDLFLSGARRLVAIPNGEMRDASLAQQKVASR
jgi:AcrR family transcriptional regulator